MFCVNLRKAIRNMIKERICKQDAIKIISNVANDVFETRPFLNF